MRWVAPTEKDTTNQTLEKRLWAAADQFRANSGLKAGQYSTPVLGLIFLRFAEARFAQRRTQLEKAGSSARRVTSRIDDPKAYQAEGVLFLTPSARFDYLLARPEGSNVGRAVNEAMADIEKHNPQLKGVLPHNYQIFNGTLLKELLKKVSEIPVSLDFDAFGRIYEYFLGEFARTEGQKGGEFYTPAPIVRLMVEILEPFHGRILDPACGFGGHVRPVRALRRRAQEEPLVRALHLRRREDRRDRAPRPHEPRRAWPGGRDPPRRRGQQLLRRPAQGRRRLRLRPRQSAVQRQRGGQGAPEGRRRPGPALPLRPAAHRQRQLPLDPALLLLARRQGPRRLRHGQLRERCRASELEIRKQLIQSRAVDVMVAVGPNMFYTVTLPCTLWFLDRGKKKTPRADQVLFIDARHIYRQIDRAHRDWTDAQIGFLANLVRLYRGAAPDLTLGGDEAKVKLTEVFGKKPKYADVAGLCKAASLKDIEAQGWSLNPGRYVGVAPGEEVGDEDFRAKLESLNEDLESLNARAHELEQIVSSNVKAMLEA
jgi:type I restriction enzyme M protein